jgi:hypothetical protein
MDPWSSGSGAGKAQTVGGGGPIRRPHYGPGGKVKPSPRESLEPDIILDDEGKEVKVFPPPWRDPRYEPPEGYQFDPKEGEASGAPGNPLYFAPRSIPAKPDQQEIKALRKRAHDFKQGGPVPKRPKYGTINPEDYDENESLVLPPPSPRERTIERKPEYEPEYDYKLHKEYKPPWAADPRGQTDDWAAPLTKGDRDHPNFREYEDLVRRRDDLIRRQGHWYAQGGPVLPENSGAIPGPPGQFGMIEDPNNPGEYYEPDEYPVRLLPQPGDEQRYPTLDDRELAEYEASRGQGPNIRQGRQPMGGYGFAQGGAVPGGSEQQSPDDDAAMARRRILDRTKAYTVGLQPEDIDRSISDPSRYGPIYGPDVSGQKPKKGPGKKKTTEKEPFKQPREPHTPTPPTAYPPKVDEPAIPDPNEPQGPPLPAAQVAPDPDMYPDRTRRPRLDMGGGAGDPRLAVEPEGAIPEPPLSPRGAPPEKPYLTPDSTPPQPRRMLPGLPTVARTPPAGARVSPPSEAGAGGGTYETPYGRPGPGSVLPAIPGVTGGQPSGARVPPPSEAGVGGGSYEPQYGSPNPPPAQLPYPLGGSRPGSAPVPIAPPPPTGASMPVQGYGQLMPMLQQMAARMGVPIRQLLQMLAQQVQGGS